MSWQRQGSVLAWAQDWQRPNKTEEWAYERSVATLRYDPFHQLVCFPWATLIDLLRHGQPLRAQPLLEALRWAPPRITLRRATVMQHIWARDMLPHLQALGITDLYWPHATQAEAEWPGGIRVHPFPLYPVCCATDADPAATLPPQERPYLYSFIGAYEPGLYLSAARQWIFELPPRADARVQRRGEWHYDAQVYRGQIGGASEAEAAVAARQAREREYREVLAQSVFSLCPSGSGPNSIRLWESLGMGCIPVLLADTLRLPGDPALWQAAAVIQPERADAVARLPQLLAELAAQPSLLEAKQSAVAQLWQRYGLQAQASELMPSSRPVVSTSAGRSRLHFSANPSH